MYEGLVGDMLISPAKELCEQNFDLFEHYRVITKRYDIVYVIFNGILSGYRRTKSTESILFCPLAEGSAPLTGLYL